MDKKTNNRLLVLDSADNGAQGLLGLLKAGKDGWSSERVVDKTSLLDAFKRQDWALLLLHEKAPGVSLADALACIAHFKRSTVVMMMSESEPGFSAIAAALQDGAAGMVSLAGPEQSLLLLRREFDRIGQLSGLASLRRENSELRDRCKLLLNASRDAIAYVHEGMHIHANEAYIRLFGCADLEEVLGTPLVDMVRKEDRDKLKTMLKGAGEAGGKEVEVRPRGGEGVVVLRMKATFYEGESCLQIMAPGKRQRVRPGGQAAQPPAQQAPPRRPAIAPEASAPREGAGSASAAATGQPAVQAPHAPENRHAATAPANVPAMPRQLLCEPVISTADIEAEFYEVRPVLAGGQELAPGEALARIAASGKGAEIDRWMLDESLGVIEALYDRGQALQFALPFSRESLWDKQLPAMLAARLKNCRLDSQSLIACFTREALLEDAASARAALEGLAGQGIRICVRDYRPEPAMEQLLAGAGCQYGMLDTAAVLATTLDATARAQVQRMIDSLHGLRAKVIATGVNNADNLRFLWEAKVDLVQGSYFQQDARAMTTEAFSEELEVLRNAV